MEYISPEAAPDNYVSGVMRYRTTAVIWLRRLQHDIKPYGRRDICVPINSRSRQCVVSPWYISNMSFGLDGKIFTVDPRAQHGTASSVLYT